MQSQLTLERSGPVATLWLADPEHGNRLTAPLLEALAAECRTLAGDGELRAVVLAATAAPFCTGWDACAGPAAWPGLIAAADSFRAIAGLPVPAIAAVEGEACGAGAELALACDLRVAGSTAHFAFPDVGQGRMPAAGGTQRLARLVGRARALEMVLWGDPLDAAQALRWGLVNRVAPDGGAYAEALGLARRVAAQGPLGVRFSKEAVLRGLDLPLDEGLRLETDLTVILQSTADRAEGVRAFLEKRAPRFRGD